jgi:integrase/recombinase XerD
MTASTSVHPPAAPVVRPTARRRKPALPALRLDLVIEEYARDLARQHLSAKTIKGYAYVLDLTRRFWERHLGHPPTLDDVTVRNAEAFLDHLRERGKIAHWQTQLPAGKPLSVETVRTYVRALKVFASWLHDPKQDYTKDQRLALLPMPRKGDVQKMPLDTPEVEALLAACDTTTVLGSRDHALLLTLLDGSLRASEVTGLSVGDVNLDKGTLFIRFGKGQKSRTVAVGANTRRVLRRYAFLRDASHPLGPATPDAPFFQTDDGRRFQYEGLRRWFTRLKRRADVSRAFPHLLRHTSAVRTLEVPGSDIFTLKEKLGHADIATTMRYLRMTTEKLSERQRAFSPVDHLNLGGVRQLPPKSEATGHQWHKRAATPAAPQATPSEFEGEESC